jgi:diadenosine tetraphosphatase ApaH/serine/threonine PP2A family protein phosphatase
MSSEEVSFRNTEPGLFNLRIAILSDIHSNLQALTRVLAAVDKQEVGEVYCLGDIVGYGPHPNECVDLLRERSTMCVLGNHDVAAIEPLHAEGFNKVGRIAAEWTHEVLTKENSEYIKKLPYLIDTESCTIVHASPYDPDAWNYVLSLEAAGEQFEHFQTPLCFIGHSHVPFVCGEDLRTFTFKPGLRFLINVGSVGQPRDGNPEASFGLLDTDSWSYELFRVAYDIEKTAAAIREAGLPEFLARRLFQGI